MTTTLVGLSSLEPPERGCSVTIGTFDGVHLGHRALIARAAAEAREREIASAIVTWDRHPNETLRPDQVPPLVTSPERKVELLEERGCDLLAVLAFDRALSQMPPERFVEEVLVKGLAARAVFVGEGWRFGHRAAGDVDLLTRVGAEAGFTAEAVTLETIDGEPASSTRVRRAVADGDLELAAKLLARPFDLDGVVARGAGRGRALGFPTANFVPDPALALPPRGVYAARARAGQSWYVAAVNVGVNPTFGGDPATTPLQVEAYLVEFDGDLYDQTLRVEFHERLRDELRFETQEELITQMKADVEATQELFADAG